MSWQETSTLSIGIKDALLWTHFLIDGLMRIEALIRTHIEDAHRGRTLKKHIETHQDTH